MKLLFDANLSRRLARSLGDLFPGSLHVEEAGLGPEDRDIWRHAFSHGYVIVSKDTDFYNMSMVRGAPPKIIWLRIGNCSTRMIEAVLRANSLAILEFEFDESAALLIIEKA